MWEVRNEKAETFLPSLANNFADVIITDIPYNEVNERAEGEGKNPLKQTVGMNKGNADSDPVDLEWLVPELIRVAKYAIYVWCGYEQISPIVKGFRTLGLSGVRVGSWRKTNPSPANGQYFWLSDQEFWVFGRKPRSPWFGSNHSSTSLVGKVWRVENFPCPKNPEVLRQQIVASCPIGGLVVDPYCGSGMTGVACQPDYNFLGNDHKPETVKIARLEIGKAIDKTSGVLHFD